MNINVNDIVTVYQQKLADAEFQIVTLTCMNKKLENELSQIKKHQQKQAKDEKK